jgi:cyclopropane fatty-acyl-phospholipid synthase-like methyltransferase
MWRLKVLTQFVLAHLPGGERVNYLFQLVKKSHSDERLAKNIINLVEIMRLINRKVGLEGKAVLEIGTGWNAIGALLFYLMGAETCYTYDHVPHVRFELVQRVIRIMQNQSEQIETITSLPSSVLTNRLRRLEEANNLDELFRQAHIIYKAPGDATQTGLADHSIDLVFSHAVLEHVPEEVIHRITAESKRILKKDGIAYHAIGLHDHYASFAGVSKVNFLKYPEWLWAFFIKNKISYHNRLREKEHLDIFRAHGAKIEWIENKTDPADLEILKTIRVDKRFAGMTPEELAIYYTEVLISF